MQNNITGASFITIRKPRCALVVSYGRADIHQTDNLLFDFIPTRGLQIHLPLVITSTMSPGWKRRRPTDYYVLLWNWPTKNASELPRCVAVWSPLSAIVWKPVTCPRRRTAWLATGKWAVGVHEERAYRDHDRERSTLDAWARFRWSIHRRESH